VSISPPRTGPSAAPSWPDRTEGAGIQAWQLLRRASLEAVRGNQASCRSRVAEAGIRAGASQQPALDAGIDHVLGLLELTLGNFNIAVWHLNRCGARLHLLGLDDPALVRYEPDLVESLVAQGRHSHAFGPVMRLSLRAERFCSDWGRSAAYRCRGLLACADTFEPEFRAALAFHGDVNPFDRARTQLLFGERLRRARRRVDARDQLSAALDTFERLGAIPWTARAARELEATSVTARPRHDPSITDELTPQERTVVGLMVEGVTVREAALRLFLSPKTVEAHLGRAYRKLGVRNRAQLALRVSRA
jgi:DNA-binding CsgD family transcriptional regulator